MATTMKAEQAEQPQAQRPAGAGERPAGRHWDPLTRLDETYAELERLGLQQYAIELDKQGFTIVPPEKIGPPDLPDRLLDAALRIAEEESGVRPDLETGATHSDVPDVRGSSGRGLFKFQEEFSNLIFKDRVFEEYATNETLLALMTYLLGEHCEFAGGGPGVWFRGPSDAPEGFIPPSLHSDLYGVPSPFAPYAQLANSQYALSDFSFDGGCIGFVPGSNHLQRHPLHGGEMLEKWVPAACPRGSLVIWQGNTWHTIGNPRTIPGLRISMGALFCRPYMRPISINRELVTDELLERNPARLATLMGLNNRFGNYVTELHEDRRSRRLLSIADKGSPINGPASKWE